MPLSAFRYVLSAGANGRDVIVSARTSFQDGATLVDATRIDHVTGTSTPLPDLLAASGDASTIVTDDFRWVDLDTATIVDLPSVVPRDYSSVVISPDGGTVAVRQPSVGQRSWIVAVDRATSTATASLVPISGVVGAISDGGRYVLMSTSCRTNSLTTPPSLDCSSSVRWDRQLRTVASLGGPGRFVGGGIGPEGEVVIRSGDATTITALLNQPGQPEVPLVDAPFGIPTITAGGRIVLFTTISSGFSSFVAYDRISGQIAGLAGWALQTGGARNGLLSTDGSTFVSVNFGTQDRPPPLALVWTPVTVARSPARVRANEVLPVHVAGSGGVGADASSAMLSVTVTDPRADGFATVWPCGQPQPLASNLNFVAGQTRANAVLSQIGTNGDICVASNVAINLLVDVQGWFGPTSSYRALTPIRVVDTRTGPDPTTGAIDSVAGLRIPLGASKVLGSNASAVMLNITATNAAANGFVTMWPCGTPRPTASNLNIVPGTSAANAVLTGIGGSGDVCVSSNVATDIIVDLQGWFEGASDYQATNPVRLIDTRNGELDTVGNQGGEQTLTIPIAVRAGQEPAPTAAMLNLTITNSDQPGYATVWPCDEPRPLASNINFSADETLAVAVLARASDDGTVCVATNTRSDVIVDLNGSLTGAGSYHPLPPNRLVDTRI